MNEGRLLPSNPPALVREVGGAPFPPPFLFLFPPFSRLSFPWGGHHADPRLCVANTTHTSDVAVEVASWRHRLWRLVMGWTIVVIPTPARTLRLVDCQRSLLHSAIIRRYTVFDS